MGHPQVFVPKLTHLDVRVKRLTDQIDFVRPRALDDSDSWKGWVKQTNVRTARRSMVDRRETVDTKALAFDRRGRLEGIGRRIPDREQILREPLRGCLETQSHDLGSSDRVIVRDGSTDDLEW